MKKSSSNLIYYLLLYLLIAFYSCLRIERTYMPDYWLYLSKATKKDRERKVEQLWIDTFDLVKLKSLKKVDSYNIGKAYSDTPVDKALEMLSQLDSVPHLVLRKIDSMPSNIGKLKGVRAMAIIDANTEVLPESLGQLTALELLQIGYSDLSRCNYKIKSLPDSFSKLQSLLTLQITNTAIKTVPQRLCVLKKLNLSIRENPMDSLPNCICNINMVTTRSGGADLLEKLPCAERFRPKPSVLDTAAANIAEPTPPKPQRKRPIRDFFIDM